MVRIQLNSNKIILENKNVDEKVENKNVKYIK